MSGTLAGACSASACGNPSERNDHAPERDRIRVLAGKRRIMQSGTSSPGGNSRPEARPDRTRASGPSSSPSPPLLLPALLPQALSAREDSARLVFQKSAGPRKTRLHVVKKGEFITGIFRSQLGDEPVPYRPDPSAESGNQESQQDLPRTADSASDPGNDRTSRTAAHRRGEQDSAEAIQHPGG